jgi:antitoxin PrlF
MKSEVFMVKKSKGKICCSAVQENAGRCYVESVVSVDERGQMVLPKAIRDRAGIKAGAKLTVVGWEQDGRICCISLVKTEDFSGMLKGLLSPMMKQIIVKGDLR